MESELNFEIHALKPSSESLGAAVVFLSNKPPFSNYDFGGFSQALQLQIGHGHHLCALRERRIIGYCGWLLTTEAIGEAWIRGIGKLRPTPRGDSNAAAITVVAADERWLAFYLIRAGRALAPPDWRIYFKRSYADGRERKSVFIPCQV
jgi:hypothetical protein